MPSSIRASRRLGALLGLSLLFVGAPPVSASPLAKFTLAVSGLFTLDPARVSTPAEAQAVAACFEGLTTIDPATGQARAAAAASWETSADGTKWTFHIRPESRWAKRAGDKFEVQAPVKAGDFVFAWTRLLDPDTRSPSAPLLDVCVDARVVSRNMGRADAMNEAASALEDLRKRTPGGISGEDVVTFVNESGIRGCACTCTDPAVVKLLAWKATDPMDSAKAKSAKAGLDKEALALRAAGEDAKKHVGVDRGFYAKDEKTLVVETRGPAPYLPRLLAHPALAPLFEKSLKRREQAFEGSNIIVNGPYASRKDAPRAKRSETIVDVPKLLLDRNTEYWNAAAVKTPLIECWIEGNDAAERYAKGEIQWIAFQTPVEMAKIRGASDPAWKGDDERQTKAYRAVAPDHYSFIDGGVVILRFRCDRDGLREKSVRQALASLIDRAALAKKMGADAGSPTARFVQAGATGASASVPTASFDKAKAKEQFGKTTFADFTLLYEDAFDAVAAQLLKPWQSDLNIDVATRAGYEDFKPQMKVGKYHAAISLWRPQYDDPMAFLEGFATGSPGGDTGWSSPAYDALIAAASDVGSFVKAPDGVLKSLKDAAPLKGLVDKAAGGAAPALEDVRLRLLHEAEAMLLEEAVVVPLWQSTESGAARRGIQGLRLDPAVKHPLVDFHLLTEVSFDG